MTSVVQSFSWFDGLCTNFLFRKTEGKKRNITFILNPFICIDKDVRDQMEIYSDYR